MQTNLFEELIGRQSKKTRYNPRPVIPPTNWKRPEFISLRNASSIMVDVETDDPDLKEFGPGWARGVGQVVGVAIGADNDYRAYYPCRHSEEKHDNFDPEQLFAWLNVELGRKHQPKINHNIFYDYGWLRHEGVKIQGPLICTQSAETLIEFEGKKSLEAVGLKYTGGGKTSYELLLWLHKYYGTGPATEAALAKMKGYIHKTPPRLCAQYGEGDVDLPYWCWQQQRVELERLGMMPLFNMEMHLLPLLADTRFAGVTVDVDAAEIARDALADNMDEVYGQIREIIGYDINPGSSNEVAKYLKGQGVRLIYTADGAPSVTGEFLEELGMPVANLISEWRDNRKIKNTFLESYVLKSNIRGKIYGTFKPMQAKTGRMAAESPNLQNLPSRDALAKKVRKVFIPDVGHRIWVKGDYSSIEYRGLAHFATGEGSDALRRQYHNDPNTDYHKFTIEMIAKLTGQTLGRPHVKQVNFSILYGAQIKKLAAILGMDLKAAAALMQAYHAGLPYVNSTMAWASNLVHTVGHSETIMGRRVYFDTWEPQYRERGQYTPPLPYNEALCSYGANIKRSMAYRALNYVIQGTAAEVLKAGQVACYQAGLYDILGPPRMYVHDETDFSLPDMTPEIMEALAEVKHLMENAIPLKVPVKVDFEYGPNWSELYNLDLS